MPTVREIPDGHWRRIKSILEEFWLRQATRRKVAYGRRGPSMGSSSDGGAAADGTDSRSVSPPRTWFTTGSGDGCEAASFEKVWEVIVSECDELGGVGRPWPSADAVLGKAGPGGEKAGKNPTDRGKTGTKQSLPANAEGGPLSGVIARTKVVDHELLGEMIESIAVERPDFDEGKQNGSLSADDSNRHKYKYLKFPN